MPIQIYTIPVHDDGRSVEALNQFLASHRILSVERHFVTQGTASFWTFCVDYLEGAPAATPSRFGVGKSRVDYREKLAPDDFAVFARLRDERKVISQTEGVPVYTIFTNEQLAQMVENKVRTRGDLEKIAGVGDGRIDKYKAAS